MAKSESNAPTYTEAELLEHAEALFGVKPEVLKGALHDQSNDQSNRSFTVDQAQSLIDRFLRKKVTT